jgi:hypothetical protein
MGTYISGLKYFIGPSNIRIGKPIPVNILTQPIGTVINEGESYTLYIKSKGTLPFRYQWFRNGVPILNANSNILKIENATNADHDGIYYCAVTNILDTVKSTSVTLTVITPIVITQQPVSVFAQPNSIAVFSIDYTGGGTIYRSWFFKDSPLLSYNKTLSVFNVTTNNIGEYYCVLSNQRGSLTSNKANLNYIYPIEITKHPQNTKIVPNGSLTLTCEITGAYPATYFWRKDGIEIPDSAKTITDINNKICVYSAPVVANGFIGDYDCVITNVTKISAISNIAKVVLDNTINLNYAGDNTLYITTQKGSDIITIDSKWDVIGQNTKNISTGTKIYNPAINQTLTDFGPQISTFNQSEYIIKSTIISIINDRTFKIDTLALSTGNSIANLDSSTTISKITTTKDSDIVYVSSTIGLVVGMTIKGPNIPEGAIIIEILSNNTIRLSINATASGDVYDAGIEINQTQSLNNIIALKGSNIISVNSTVGLYIGMKIESDAFPPGTVITKINSDGTIEVSNVAIDDSFNSSATTNVVVTLQDINTTANSNIITIKSTEGLSIGSKVIGIGIPEGAIITKILGPTSFEISVPATATTINQTGTLDTLVKLIISTTTDSDLISANTTANIIACTKLIADGIPNEARITEIINDNQFRISIPATQTITSQIATTEIVENNIIASLSTINDSDIIKVTCTVGLVVGAEITAPNIPYGSVILKIIDSTTLQISNKATTTAESTNATVKISNPLYFDGKLYQGFPINKEVGEDIYLSVKVSSLNQMTYQWMKKNFGRIDNQTNTTYYISDLKQYDSGDYYAVIIDQFSNTSTNTVTLNVTSNYVVIENEDYLVFDNNVYWKI